MKSASSFAHSGRWVGVGLCVVAAAAFAANWTLVGTDADGNSYSVDASRIAKDGTLVSLQVRTEYAKPRRNEPTGKDVFVALDRMIVDCSQQSFAVESRTMVTADGTEILGGATARENLRFRTAAPGSMSETLVRFACEPKDGEKSRN